MSSRQLRKLQKQKELEALEAGAQDQEDGSESGDAAPAQKSKSSVFSSFAALGGDTEDAADEDDDEAVGLEEPEPAEAPTSSSKKGKKKKKKKAKKTTDDAAQGAKPGARPSDEADEIDRALRELNLAEKSGADATAEAVPAETKAYERMCALLRVNTQHLRVLNEMRSLFGREAIASARAEELEEEARARRARAAQRPEEGVDLETFLRGTPGRSLPEVTLRRNPFLLGKETWPKASTDGLTMQQITDGTVDVKCGAVEFGFVHNENYNNQESQFFATIQLHDPMQLVHFLSGHPYHVSSLIQVSKVAQQNQDAALSADLRERALFTFGRVSLSAFRTKIEQGKARLEFRRPENRQFWLAGYHYLKSLIMKGTYRTGLEWAKLLFSMDLSDPYGIIHFIHPLAIRAYESKWFIEFCDSEALDHCDTAPDYIRQTLVLARLQQGDTAGAKVLLIEGMERLPWLYSSLFKAFNLDVPRAIWGFEPRDAHEEFFTQLYIHQTKKLWDNIQAMALLKDAASSATKPSPGSLAALPDAGLNVARFVYLDNTPALMSLVPDNMLHTFPNWDFDPLPPPKADNIFSHESQTRPWATEEEPRRLLFQDLPIRALNNQFMQGPGSREALQRMLEAAREGGVPADMLQMLEEALGENDGEGEDEDGGLFNEAGDDDGEARAGSENAGEGGRAQSIWRSFLDAIWPVTMIHEDVDDDDDADETLDGWADVVAPGAWPEDDEDMPPLIRGYDPGRSQESDESDDEMPPLEPA